MERRRESWQWQLSVVVYHGPGFGHRIEFVQQSKGRDALIKTGGSWNSLGIPEQVMQVASTQLIAMFAEHMVNRYGIQGELPIKWAGEPDPF